MVLIAMVQVVVTAYQAMLVLFTNNSLKEE
jgi:hypothetical protein